jgi:hypothetical protein
MHQPMHAGSDLGKRANPIAPLWIGRGDAVPEEWEQTVKLVQDLKDASALRCLLAAPHCSARP